MALAWMRKEDWPRWLEIDPEFQPDYAHWLARMNAASAQLTAQGVPVMKVIVDPDEFLAWSRENGQGIGSTDRASFAVFKMTEADRKGERH